MEKKKKTGWIICAAVLLLLLAAYLAGVLFCMEHFSFGTTINGMQVGGKTAQEAEQIISNQLDTYKITLLEREGKTEELSGSQIGVAFVFADEFLKLLETQNAFGWFMDFFSKPAYELEQTVTYDEALLETALLKLSAMQPENQREPVNAGYSEYTGSGYELIPADYGTKLNFDKVKTAVADAAVSLHETVDLDTAGCYELPAIGDDHKALNELLQTLNTYVATEIHYEFGSNEEVLEKDTIASWLSVDDNMEVVVDEDAVLSYVKGLAKKYNTAYSTKKLMTSYGVEVSITGGAYGWRIDNGGERTQILEDLKTGEVIAREAVFLTRANSFDGPDYGNSYVELNLSAQHLFLYVNGKLIVESDFVSGRVSRGDTTPTGAYPVTYITRNATLRGTNYATPVSYWMPFNGNIGMHDLTSRKSFGSDIYMTGGSHGCINLPYEAAKTIYEHIEAGFPVLCYKLDGSESEQVRASKAATVIRYINAIGPVTAQSGSAITTARRLYDEVGSSVRAQVTNYEVLVNAEAEFAALKAGR